MTELKDGESYVIDQRGVKTAVRSECFYCSFEYEPWGQHGMTFYQGIDVEEDDDWGWEEIMISNWYQGYHACNHREVECEKLWPRIKNAFRLLRGRSISDETLIMKNEEVRRMAEYLMKITDPEHIAERKANAERLWEEQKKAREAKEKG